MTQNWWPIAAKVYLIEKFETLTKTVLYGIDWKLTMGDLANNSMK